MEKLQDHEGGAIIELTDILHIDDSRVIDGCRGFGLSLEANEGVVIRGDVRVEKLDRHLLLANPDVARLEDGTHATLTDQAGELVLVIDSISNNWHEGYDPTNTNNV